MALAQLSAASGGQKPYTYTWNDGYVGEARTGLCKGSYTVTVKDKAGCTSVVKLKIICGGTPALLQRLPAAQNLL